MSSFEERRAAALAAVQAAQIEQARKAVQRENRKSEIVEALSPAEKTAVTDEQPSARRILAKALHEMERHIDALAKQQEAGLLTTQEASALEKYASACLRIAQAEAAIEKKKRASLEKMTEAELRELLSKRVSSE